MKRLLILFLVALLSVSAVFAQAEDYVFDYTEFKIEDPETGEFTFDIDAALEEMEANDVDESALIPVLLDEDVSGDVSIQEFIPESGEVDENGDPIYLTDEQLAEFEVILEEEGFDPEIIASTVEVVDQMANDGLTANEIKEADPELFEVVEDAIVTVVAEEISGSLIPEETRGELSDALSIAGNALEILNGFGQATANTSVTNSLFGYQDYKLFVLSIGTLGSISIPKPLETFNAIQAIDMDQDVDLLIKDFRDLNAEVGIAMQGLTLSLGLNLSWLIEDFYLTAIFGSTLTEVSSVDGIYVEVLTQPQEVPAELPEDLPFTMEMETGSLITGLKANFQLVNGFGIPILFRWNGLSVGTGYINTNLYTKAALDLSEAMNLPEDSLGVEFSIDSMVHTIPLEVSTGFQLLSLATVTAGAGVDFQFGSSQLHFGLPPNDSLGGKLVNQILADLMAESDLSFPYESTGEVAVVNPRLSAGVGVGLGPFVLDLTAHYFINTGLAFGFNTVIRI